MASESQTTAGALLAAENHGTEVIVRDSDGAVFVRRDVAERVIDRLQTEIAIQNTRIIYLETELCT